MKIQIPKFALFVGFLIINFKIGHNQSIDLIGKLDSVSPLSPVEQALFQSNIAEALKDECEMPGAIPNYYEDGDCEHPLYNILNKFERQDTIGNEKKDSSIIWNFQTAISTYKKFETINKQTSDHEFSHERYSNFITKAPKLEQPNKFFYWIQKIKAWIIEFIWEPFLDLFLTPFKSLSHLWKIIFGFISGLILFGTLYLLSAWLQNHYQVVDLKQEKHRFDLSHSSQMNYSLQSALEHLDINNFQESVNILYLWMLTYFSHKNDIKRYEWWTNKQLLELIQNRFRPKYEISKAIINQYEKLIYGHHTSNDQEIRTLIDNIKNSQLFV